LLRWLVQFPVLHGQGDALLVGKATDLSEDGMGFLTYQPYAVDSVLTLELLIPSGRIKVKGRVRNCRNGRAGVQFVNISPQQRLALLDYCMAGKN
jgi:hypothetical protein